MSDFIKLKPCPFCGEMVHLDKSGMFRITYIVCDGCGACISFHGRESRARAAEAFNRRKKGGNQDE